MITKNSEETIEYGQKFAQKLKGGEVIGLIGELGAGKTVFVKGLAQGLGIKEKITSPTFVILKEYHANRANHAKNILRPKDHLRGGLYKVKTMVHIDAYRIESLDDIKSAGIQDYLGRDDIIVAVEWAEKIKKILPKNTIYIKFKHKSENQREIILK